MSNQNDSALFEKHWGKFKKTLELYLRENCPIESEYYDKHDWINDFMNEFVKFSVSEKAKLLLAEIDEESKK